MKKTVIWSILGVALLTIFFYLSEKEEKIEPKYKATKVWKIEEPKVDTPKSYKDKNSSIVNKKPTVWIDGFSIMSVGDVMTLHSKAKDEDGNISSYLWQEEGKILGRKPELPLMLSKEGKHTITLRVTDNLGAMAKSSIEIDVFAPYDKKVFYQHRHCHCKGLTYSYFNDEGNLTKEITENKDGIVVKEFTYNNEGKLLSMHYKNYYDESRLIKESTTFYNKFGQEIEEIGKEKEYYSELDDDKLVSFHSRHKYNEKGQMIESSMENNGVLNQVEKYVYDKDGHEQSYVYEDYKEGILKSKSIRVYTYDENGKLLSETSQEYDSEREIITASTKEERRYNEAKQILEKRVDNNGDGEMDEYTYYVYDNANRLLEERYKSNDKSSESLTSYSYSTEGLLLQEETKSEGKIEDIKHYTYNSKGQKTSSSTDYDGDGLIDYASKIFYDNEGNRIKEESYKKGVLSSSNIYNSDGKIVESNRGGYNMRYIYDEETGVLKHLLIKEPSGQMSIKYYDDAGELIKEVDENGKVFYEVDRR